MQGSIDQAYVRLQVVCNAALTDTLCDAASGPLDEIATAIHVAVENATGGIR